MELAHHWSHLLFLSAPSGNFKTYVGIPCFVPLSPQDSGEEELVDGKTDHKLKGAVGFFHPVEQL